MGGSWLQNVSQTPPGCLLGGSWAALGPSWAPSSGQHGSDWAPKTEPKSSKNQSKNRAKNRYPQESILSALLMISGVQMEPIWYQHLFQNRCQLQMVIFRNGTSRLMPNEVSEIEVGSKNELKNDKKMESRWECILESFFDDFG